MSITDEIWQQHQVDQPDGDYLTATREGEEVGFDAANSGSAVILNAVDSGIALSHPVHIPLASDGDELIRISIPDDDLQYRAITSLRESEISEVNDIEERISENGGVIDNSLEQRFITVSRKRYECFKNFMSISQKYRLKESYMEMELTDDIDDYDKHCSKCILFYDSIGSIRITREEYFNIPYRKIRISSLYGRTSNSICVDSHDEALRVVETIVDTINRYKMRYK